MAFVKLMTENGKPVWVNPHHVTKVGSGERTDKDLTKLLYVFGADSDLINMPPEEVAALLNEAMAPEEVVTGTAVSETEKEAEETPEEEAEAEEAAGTPKAKADKPKKTRSKR